MDCGTHQRTNWQGVIENTTEAESLRDSERAMICSDIL